MKKKLEVLWKLVKVIYVNYVMINIRISLVEKDIVIKIRKDMFLNMSIDLNEFIILTVLASL